MSDTGARSPSRGRPAGLLIASCLLLLPMAAAAQSRSTAGGVAPAPAAPMAAPAAPAVPPAAAAPATADVQPRVLLIPQRETTVVAQIVGQVSRLGGDLGASVSQGSTLVMFDCGELEAKLKMSEAELNSARENHQAKVRLQGLNAAGEVEVSMAAAAAEKARAQLDLSRAQLRQCVIPAPFAGRIVKLHVKQYQAVNVGQPLVDLVSGGPLKVKLNAPSKWLAWLKPGTKFEVMIDETGKTYPAVVSAINGRVDAVSQSVELEGRVSGAYAELLAGMSGNARFARP
ncbi:MAG TPA: efflux RND transporter periplasmic adaptor subunit [Burkholderiaceae bacterium]|nr:efflux RND transporter periplasmic adaptor subunit [Burkholderiaceae bacterium]